MEEFEEIPEANNPEGFEETTSVSWSSTDFIHVVKENFKVLSRDVELFVGINDYKDLVAAIEIMLIIVNNYKTMGLNLETEEEKMEMNEYVIQFDRLTKKAKEKL